MTENDFFLPSAELDHAGLVPWHFRPDIFPRWAFIAFYRKKKQEITKFPHRNKGASALTERNVPNDTFSSPPSV